LFKEFSRCSPRGFMLSLLAGAAVIGVFAVLASALGNFNLLKAGFILGLIGARFAEGLFSRSCSPAKVGLEGAVLALVGVGLVIVDDLLIGLFT
jgi:hypothetical protein